VLGSGQLKRFTLIELLIVIAVLGIIISLLQPAIVKTLALANTTTCMAQERQLMIGINLFAEDKEGFFPSPEDRVTKSNPNSWIDDYLGSPYANTAKAIEGGVLFPYVGDVNLYRCPEDERHAVTYQMSMFVGGTSTSSFNTTTIHKVNVPQNKLVFVEEDCWRTVSAGAWGIFVSTSKPETNLGSWWDDVANWHSKGMNVTFVDGHSEHWEWVDPRTRNPDPISPNGLGTTWHQTHPGSLDTDRTQRAYLGLAPKN